MTTAQHDAAEPIEGAIARLQSPDTPVEYIAETMNRLHFALERAKELLKAGEAAIEERIRETGQSIECGEYIYMLTTPKDTKCRDNAEALASMLEQFTPQQIGRDFLGSGAWKYGSVKKAVDQATFDRLFVVEVKDKLRRELSKVPKFILEGR